MSQSPYTLDPLELIPITNYKIKDLVPSDGNLEASGVTRNGNELFVVFDNLLKLAKLTINPKTGALTGQEWIKLKVNNKSKGTGFEGIVYHAASKRFYAVIESLERKKGDDKVWNAKVVPIKTDKPEDECSAEWMDFELESGNKGFEGLTVLDQKEADPQLLALCEGNECRSGKAGQTPGGGQILVFRKKSGEWIKENLIKIPESVRFEDYSGIDIAADGTVAVVSQASSSLWVGKLNRKKLKWADAVGHTYIFPRTGGEYRFCNIEGVIWANKEHTKIIVVSDKAKGDQPDWCRGTDQSIHVFELPIK